MKRHYNVFYYLALFFLILFGLFILKIITIYPFLKSIFYPCVDPMFCESVIDPAPAYDLLAEVFLMTASLLSFLLASLLHRKAKSSVAAGNIS